jgi:hypothetical protein
MAKRKNPAAVALGRLGGLAGGKKGMRSRLAKSTPEERQALARKAIRARWRKATAADRRRQHLIMLRARKAKKK